MGTKTPEQTALAYEVLDFCLANPDKHDQSYWLLPGPIDARPASAERCAVDAAQASNWCGTTACYAGWTVLLSGKRIAWSMWGIREEGSSPWVTETVSSVAGVAMRMLGLTYMEAHEVFQVAQTPDDVADEIERIYGPRPVGV